MSGAPATVLIRWLYAAATVFCGAMGLAVDDKRFFAASGAFGLLWWLWDVVVDHVLRPIEYFLEDLVTGGIRQQVNQTTWSVSDRIRLLESQLQEGRPRRLQIHAALRLAEIHELQRKDPASAKQVLEKIRERYPDAPEIRRFSATFRRRHGRTGWRDGAGSAGG